MKAPTIAGITILKIQSIELATKAASPGLAQLHIRNSDTKKKPAKPPRTPNSEIAIVGINEKQKNVAQINK